MNKFEIIITKYADEFLSSLSEKARDKIIYNLDKCSNGYADKNLFKKLDGTDIWEFRTLYIMAYVIDCCLFGTQKNQL